MKIGDWIPVYRELVSDMGYDERADADSGVLLSKVLAKSDIAGDDEIAARFGGAAVVVGGAFLKVPENIPDGTLVSAGSATGALVSAGIIPDIIVTDLDGDVESQIEASAKGALTFIHAHGDNTEAVGEYAPLFPGKVAPTVQGNPHGILRNYGGFTDGDRAVCICEHFGASSVSLLGFDFDNPVPNTAVKAKKLAWARRIIRWREENGLTVRLIT